MIVPPPITRRTLLSLSAQQRIAQANNENAVQSPVGGSLLGGPKGKSYVPGPDAFPNTGFLATITSDYNTLPPGTYYAQPQFPTINLTPSALDGTTAVFGFSPINPTGMYPQIIVTNLAEFQGAPGGSLDYDGGGCLTPNQVIWVFKAFGLIVNGSKSTGGVIYLTNTPLTNFICALTQNGGSAGSNSAVCSYNYDVFDLADTMKTTKLNGGTPISPKGSPIRVTMAQCFHAGSLGLAYYDNDNAIQLAWVFDETGESNACS
jgi:hypothetical protein